jgi:hypothetical protein
MEENNYLWSCFLFKLYIVYSNLAGYFFVFLFSFSSGAEGQTQGPANARQVL